MPAAAVRESIQVCCRFRPENEMEKASNRKIVAEGTATTVEVHGSNHQGVYNFDKVFHGDVSQKEVYEFAGEPIVNATLQGINGTVFAYGQTGSGKTYTMEGPDMDDKDSQGVIPRMVSSVFQGIISKAHEGIDFEVKVSIAEIYNERIKDLLDVEKDNLQIREVDGHFYIDGITEKTVGDEKDAIGLLFKGHERRSKGETNMNELSSRSHLVFVMKVIQTCMDKSTMVGKLHLVDLAGSENQAKTGSSGVRQAEAQNINTSLFSLGQVIHALTDKSSTHIPYRGSKLTRILQDSLGGNSKTSLIITCSPSSFNESETINTLRFGERANSIKNKPKVNREHTPQQLKDLLTEARARISELEQGGISASPGAQVTLTQGPAAAAGPDTQLGRERIQNAERISELSRENSEMKQRLQELQDKNLTLGLEMDGMLAEKRQCDQRIEELVREAEETSSSKAQALVEMRSSSDKEVAAIRAAQEEAQKTLQEDRERILQELTEERTEKQSLQDKLVNIEKDRIRTKKAPPKECLKEFMLAGMKHMDKKRPALGSLPRDARGAAGHGPW